MTAFETQNIDVAVRAHEVLEGFPQSEARTDCFGALAEGVNSLERFLDEHLWLPADYPAFAGEKESSYYLALSEIEECLVYQDLIYAEGDPYTYI